MGRQTRVPLAAKRISRPAPAPTVAAAAAIPRPSGVPSLAGLTKGGGSASLHVRTVENGAVVSVSSSRNGDWQEREFVAPDADAAGEIVKQVLGTE